MFAGVGVLKLQGWNTVRDLCRAPNILWQSSTAGAGRTAVGKEETSTRFVSHRSSRVPAASAALTAPPPSTPPGTQQLVQMQNPLIPRNFSVFLEDAGHLGEGKDWRIA